MNHFVPWIADPEIKMWVKNTTKVLNMHAEDTSVIRSDHSTNILSNNCGTIYSKQTLNKHHPFRPTKIQNI